MAFTAKDVQALRERTGAGMMDCKNALKESDGDFERAVELLREKGIAKAEKKAGRIAAEGLVTAVVRGDCGVIIEVNSETDFVAKNDSFREFVALAAKTVIDDNPADVDALLRCKAPSGTIEDELREKILSIGENLKIRRFKRYTGALVPYIHGGGTHAVLVQFEVDAGVAVSGEFVTFGRDIAMQIAAINPQYVNREDVPSEEIEKEKEILLHQALNEGKPEAIAEKMVEGRVNKYYKDIVLLEQPFVKDDKISVKQHIGNMAKQLGSPIKVVAFTRYEKGEGLEKREDNFAEEVANMRA